MTNFCFLSSLIAYNPLFVALPWRNVYMENRPRLQCRNKNQIKIVERPVAVPIKLRGLMGIQHGYTAN